jgi:hypothetical protein
VTHWHRCPLIRLARAPFSTIPGEKPWVLLDESTKRSYLAWTLPLQSGQTLSGVSTRELRISATRMNALALARGESFSRPTWPQVNLYRVALMVDTSRLRSMVVVQERFPVLYDYARCGRFAPFARFVAPLQRTKT